MRLAFYRELIPTTHFAVCDTTVYFLQNRSIVAYYPETGVSSVVCSDYRLTGKVASLQYIKDRLLVATLNWRFSIDLKTGHTNFDELFSDDFKQRVLYVQNEPLVAAKQYYGCLFSAHGLYSGTGGSILFCNNVPLLTADCGPIFSISEFYNVLSFSSGKTATFGVMVSSGYFYGRNYEFSAKKQFVARTYAIDAEMQAAGSENGEFSRKGSYMRLYRAGVRAISAELVLYANGALFSCKQRRYSEFAQVTDIIVGCDNEINGYVFNADGWIWLGGARCARFYGNFAVRYVCSYGSNIVCLHYDGSISCSAGSFTRTHMLSYNSALFVYESNLFAVELLNNKIYIWSIYIEDYGLAQLFLVQTICSETTQAIQAVESVTCSNDKLFVNNILVTDKLERPLTLLLPQSVAAKEYNCACFSSTTGMLLCGSEDGLLHMLNAQLYLRYSFDLHTSIKSLCILFEHHYEIALLVGCCYNKLFFMLFHVEQYSVRLIACEKCSYFRLKYNIKYTALAVVARLERENEAVVAAGDAAGWVYLFYCTPRKFVLLQYCEVDFSVMSLEFYNNELVVCGSRGVILFQIDSDALQHFIDNSEGFGASFAYIRSFYPRLERRILVLPSKAVCDEVVHMSSRGLFARDTGRPFGLITGVLACNRQEFGVKSFDIIVGWDRIVRVYEHGIQRATFQTSVYYVHALVYLDSNTFAVVGNGISTFKIESTQSL